jgi:hypothetical protein
MSAEAMVCNWDAVYVDVSRHKLSEVLCQNCVTSPRKPPVNMVIYGDTPTRIDVAEVVDSELCWWDLMRVSTRGQSRFPSVLLQPLGHLSARVESIVYRQAAIRAKPNCDVTVT